MASGGISGMSSAVWARSRPSEKPVVDPSKELMVRLRVVSRNYFATMGIPLNGRDFTAADDVGEKIGSYAIPEVYLPAGLFPQGRCVAMT